MTTPRYTQLHADGAARLGTFRTAHGVFETPNFMPIATQGSVKGVDVERIGEMGAQIILTNSYHLWLRPGDTVVRSLGDIHGFTGWKGPILSDSGGFQVFSLREMRKLTEDGVEFQSHVDGSKRFISPEISVGIQETLGVDIAMAFDECPAAAKDVTYIEESLQRTIRWAKRCLLARKAPEATALFGITQGGVFRELRHVAACELGALPFDGMAIGGLSVGEPPELMYEVLSYHVAELPADKIRYLMGVGTPRDIVEAVLRGVDLFDCVIPTRAGRFGRAYVGGKPPFINIRNARFAREEGPLDANCRCLACRHYSRGYIHHLFRVEEMLGPQLLSLHNLTHYLDLMRRIRVAIRDNSFSKVYREEVSRWEGMAQD